MPFQIFCIFPFVQTAQYVKDTCFITPISGADLSESLCISFVLLVLLLPFSPPLLSALSDLADLSARSGMIDLPPLSGPPLLSGLFFLYGFSALPLLSVLSGLLFSPIRHE